MASITEQQRFADQVTERARYSRKIASAAQRDADRAAERATTPRAQQRAEHLAYRATVTAERATFDERTAQMAHENVETLRQLIADGKV